MRILITGAAGMVGSSLVPTLIKAGHSVFATDINTTDPSIEHLDVRDIIQIKEIIKKVIPQLVIHLAAETDVDRCEEDHDHAYKTNSLGTQNIVLGCQAIDAIMIYISTAGIFDGEKEGLYTEFDIPNPIAVYGKSKYEGEKFVQSFLKKYFIVRAGWMIGGGPDIDKKFVNKIIKQIQIGATELYAVADKFGTPTYTKDLSIGLAKLIQSDYYGLYHMACRGFGTRYDVANEILKILGREDIVLHKVNSDFFANDYFAIRPKSEMMRNLMLDLREMNFMRDWKESLREYLEENFLKLIKEQKKKKKIIHDLRKRVIILGGGLAGLAAGYKLTQGGLNVLILEKYREVGGLARTIKYKDFFFDFCAHRFHTYNSSLLEEIKTIMQGDMVYHTQKSRIYMWNKYLEYPFRFGNLLINMPFYLAIKSVIGYFGASIKRRFSPKEIVSFKDWFINNFGYQLYKTNCFPYALKLWDRDPSELSADWGSERSPFKFNLISILKEFLLNKFKKNNTLDNTTIYPDASTFYYPKEGGIGVLAKRMAEEIIARDGEVICNANVIGVEKNLDGMRVFYEKEGRKYLATCDWIISSIPLPYLLKIITPQISLDVSDIGNKFKYRDGIFINLLINKERISNDSWLYFPQPKNEIIFNRLVEFKNWSTKMAPPNKTSLCADIICSKNDEIWQKSDQEIIQKVIEGLVRVNLVKKEDVEEAFAIRILENYPIYHLGYKQDLDFILSNIEKLENIYCIGRTGRFKYNNMDDSILQGFEISEKIIENLK
jgi:dTDP-4-dehydrorhamnose reductase